MDSKLEKELLEIGRAGGSGDMTAKEIFFAIANFYDKDLEEDNLLDEDED